MTDVINWPGKSGAQYCYWFLESIEAKKLKAEAGNYAFVKRLPNGNFTPLYFGQADDLRCRLPCHERLDEAIKAGMTHVMGHTQSAGEQVRLAEERGLIQQWNPPLNVQHKKVV